MAEKPEMRTAYAEQKLFVNLLFLCYIARFLYTFSCFYFSYFSLLCLLLLIFSYCYLLFFLVNLLLFVNLSASALPLYSPYPGLILLVLL